MKRPGPKAFFKLHHQVIDSNRFRSLTLAAQSLYIHLTRLQNLFSANGDTFERRDWQLISDTGLDERTIKRGRKQLRETGFIATSRTHSKSPTTYRLFSS